MKPDLSLLWVIFFVLVLAVVLDRLLFRPLLGVMKQREETATSARAMAERAVEEARLATEDFDRRTHAARAEVYAQMDEMRKAALDERAALVAETKREAEQALTEARAVLAKDVTVARASLDQDAEALATNAIDRILGRRAS